MLRTFPHFCWTIEDWDAIGGGITVVACIADFAPAVAALEAAIAIRPEELVRLRHAPRPDQGRAGVADRLNFAVDEWDDAEHIAKVHGVFMSLEPAEAAFRAVVALRPGRVVTVRKATRVLRDSKRDG